MTENSLNKICANSEFWKKKLLNIEGLAKDYIDILAFDVEDKLIEVSDDKACEFFRLCQSKKIVDERIRNTAFTKRYGEFKVSVPNLISFRNI